MLKHWFVDLHIHIGKGGDGQWIKIPSSGRLTVDNVIREAAVRKGLDMIGLVDCASASVLPDLERMVEQGELQALPGGGYRHTTGMTVILGVELESVEQQGCMHTLFFFSNLAQMRLVAQWLAGRAKNPRLSSQNVKIPLEQIMDELAELHPIVIPAHIFTPHKSLYGSCTAQLSQVVDPAKIAAVELGLSADSAMADRLPELDHLSFVTNSDAHSLEKIGREYTICTMSAPSFTELALALHRTNGRGIVANYGMDPRLGKYHRTACVQCFSIVSGEQDHCPNCGGTQFTSGVEERIHAIAARPMPVHPAHRPPYYYQVPLQFVPGLGKRGLNALVDRFGTEMQVLHFAAEEDLADCIGAKIARIIVAMRSGQVRIAAGGGGRYGKLL